MCLMCQRECLNAAIKKKQLLLDIVDDTIWICAGDANSYVCLLYVSINYVALNASIYLLGRMYDDDWKNEWKNVKNMKMFKAENATMDLNIELSFNHSFFAISKRTPSVKPRFFKITLPRQNVLNWSFGSLSWDLLFTVQLCKTITLTCSLCFLNHDLKWVQRLKSTGECQAIMYLHVSTVICLISLCELCAQVHKFLFH